MEEYIIADNQDITKAGLMFLLLHRKDAEVTFYEAFDKAELIRLLKLHPTSTVVLDYTLFNFTGINELIALQEKFAEARWLLFSDDLSIDFMRQAIYSSPTFSVVMKDCTQDEINAALQSITHGERFICNHASNLLLSSSPQVATHKEEHLLTETEKSILKEIAFGKTTRQIAEERHLSFHTINSHRKNIFRKLEVNNVHEAIKYAVRAGIVDLAEYFI